MCIEQFYRLTLGEAAMVLRGRRKYEQAMLEARRAANYELAGLISFAMHSPKKMPRFKTMDEAEKKLPDRAPTEADHAKIRAFFKSLARMDAHGK